MPDPRQGVFETLLVINGQPIELDAHLARLEASLDVLFPRQTHPVLEMPSIPTGGLRIAVAPGADGQLAATTECRPTNGHFAPDNGGQSSTRAISLHSLRLAGGLGPHKWVDRAMLDAAQAELPESSLPLLLDEDASVLEASRANVFAVRKGALFTPPLDGRVLPGITRARVLEIAIGLGVETHETTLGHDDLLTMDEVFLTGSVRGVEPVDSIDGENLAAHGEIASALAGELRRLWLGAPVA